MTYEICQKNLLTTPKKWLITGVAGFIGSHLLHKLLQLNQTIIGIDNFSNGKKENLEDVKKLVTSEQWQKFHFIEGDICNRKTCDLVMQDVDYVLHQAALGSIPRSINDPITTHVNNVDGFLNVLLAARDAKVTRIVYASSSSVYGDNADLPKVESKVGKQLSPYAVSKYSKELYANAFAHCYNSPVIGLRYFNVFGARQNPDSLYAAVIPKWIKSMLLNEPIYIYGDGETSRDFCYVANVIQANLLAATSTSNDAIKQIYNVALNEQTSLNNLVIMIKTLLATKFPPIQQQQIIYKDFRPGDIRHSRADITKIKTLLNYQPTHKIAAGLAECIGWYIQHYEKDLYVTQ